MIHLERVILPPGLRAVAYRDGRGNLVIYVSETLDAACQRAAVVEAIRAARRTRWRTALPSAIAVLLGIRAIFARAFGVVKLRPLAWGATATTAVLGATAAEFGDSDVQTCSRANAFIELEPPAPNNTPDRQAARR